jgi:hypothetical protein
LEQNPYQPPEAPLGPEVGSARLEGDLVRALAGNYVISTGEVLQDAWQMTKGNKGVLMLALLLIALAQFGGVLLLNSIGFDDGQADMASGNFIRGYGKSLALGFLLVPFIVPLTAGTLMLTIKRAGGSSAGIDEVGAYFSHLPKLVLISIMTTLLTYIGFALFILPGIYLSIAYAFAIPLMIDHDLSPWQSLESSRRAVTHRWFPIFGTILVLYILAMMLAFTVVGIFWGFPLLMLGLAIIYRTIFGFRGDEGAESPGS